MSNHVIVAAVGAVIGLAFVGLSVRGFRRTADAIGRARRLRGSEVSDVATVGPDSGFVEVEGTARPTDEGTLPAPVGDDEAVLRYEELQHGGGQYTSAEEQVDSVPFYVEDETGRARVEVPDVNLNNPDDPTNVGGNNVEPFNPNQFSPEQPSLFLDTTAEEIIHFNDSVPGTYGEPFDTDLDEFRDKTEGSSVAFRFRERIVEPGGTAYVAGYTEPAPGGSDADVVIGGGDDPTDFVVGNKPESEVESAKHYWLPGIASLVFLGIGLAVLWFTASLVGVV